MQWRRPRSRYPESVVGPEEDIMFGIRWRPGVTVAVGLAALAIPVGLWALPAGAAIGPVSARLTVTFLGGTSEPCGVAVDGLVRMSQTEAQTLVDTGHRVVVRVWGEDSFADDLLLGPYTLTRRKPWNASQYIAAAPGGLKIHLRDEVYGSDLNEDLYPDPAMRDELYAGVRLVDSAGRTVRSGESNRVGEYDFGSGCSGRPSAAGNEALGTSGGLIAVSPWPAA
jgi:hypothetical protein